MGLSGCATISTFQTGKTTPGGKFTFGTGSSRAFYRTKSKIVGFPIELLAPAIEFYGGFGVTDFLEVNGKAMVTGEKDNGMPELYGGPSGRIAFAQERWGAPISVALGYSYYSGSIQSKQTNLQGQETRRDITKLTDKIYAAYVSRDVFSWLTIYGVYKIYDRVTKNFRLENKHFVSEEKFTDKLKGGGAGVSFNVGHDRNTHIMFEFNEIRDDDEPKKHYQSQQGMGISVDF